MQSVAGETCARWFGQFTALYRTGTEEDLRNVDLKIAHSFCVRDRAEEILGAEQAAEADLAPMSAAALLHDVGRFPQYRDYRTFRDSVSVNHGSLGASVLEAEEVLAAFSAEERQMILQAVRFHNAYAVPGNLDARAAFCLRLVRDADKLDIWRIFRSYLSLPAEARSSAAGLDLPVTSGYSPGALASILSGKMVTLADLNSLNDFMLMLHGWVFDLNFGASFRILVADGHLQAISDALPDVQGVRNALQPLWEHVRAKTILDPAEA